MTSTLDSGSIIDMFSQVQLDASKRILCVGIMCLDIVQTCPQFPAEDSTSRSTDYRWQRGGNASNTCTVLSLLGQPCELLVCLTADKHGSFLEEDLRKYDINYSHCPVMPVRFSCPVSTVILSLNTDTRTIIHHKAIDFPDLTVNNFEALNLEDYSWIHFEGRNVDEVLRMICHIEDYNNSLNSASNSSTKKHMPITVSVELERPKSELLKLLPYTDVAIVAKDFAVSQGLSNVEEVVESIARYVKPGTIIICTWGDNGAIARTADGAIVHSPAFPPREVIDTLGAGDTFNAAILYYLNKSKAKFMDIFKKEMDDIDKNKGKFHEHKRTNAEIGRNKQHSNVESLKHGRVPFIDKTVLQKTILFACSVAGTKVGLRGYDGLGKVYSDILLSFSVD